MSIEYRSVSSLITVLGRLPADVRSALRPGLEAAGAIVAERAKQNAGFSTRIPGAIYVKPSFAAGRSGVVVGVDAKKAPEGKVLEVGNARKRRAGDPNFRHPVFADGSLTRKQWKWVTQKKQPYLYPALSATKDEAEAAVAAEVRKVAQIEGLIR